MKQPSTLVQAAPVETRREDVLVSLAVTDLDPTASCFDAVAAAARRVAEKYRYWEVLVVVDAASASTFQPLMAKIENIRIIKVRADVQTYQTRVIAAAEAIGDLVLLAAARELPAVNPVEMLERARRENNAVIAERTGSHPLNPVILALGNISGFRATTRDMATAAYPRTLLNRLMTYPDRTLAMRFLPRDAGFSASHVKVTPPHNRALISGMGPRLGLIQRLLINAAPRVLNITSLLAAVTAIAALFFAVYAVAVWLLLDTVQPGWFTTSLAISLTASFLGVAIFGLSTGLLKIIDLISPEQSQDVVGEDSAIDLFSQVTSELNVELNTDRVTAVQKTTGPVAGKQDPADGA